VPQAPRRRPRRRRSRGPAHEHPANGVADLARGAQRPVDHPLRQQRLVQQVQASRFQRSVSTIALRRCWRWSIHHGRARFVAPVCVRAPGGRPLHEPDRYGEVAERGRMQGGRRSGDRGGLVAAAGSREEPNAADGPLSRPVTERRGSREGVGCKADDAVDAEAGWCPPQADTRSPTPQTAPIGGRPRSGRAIRRLRPGRAPQASRPRAPRRGPRDVGEELRAARAPAPRTRDGAQHQLIGGHDFDLLHAGRRADLARNDRVGRFAERILDVDPRCE